MPAPPAAVAERSRHGLGARGIEETERPAASLAALVAAIRALEDLKDAACALQAELAVAFLDAEGASAERAAAGAVDPGASASVRAQLRERHVARARRSAAGEVALARRESPHRGGVLLGAAEALVHEMPHTLAALRAGAVNEHRAVLLVRETACLDREGRAEVDRELCANPGALEGVGTKRLVAMAAKHAYRIDPASFVRRAERGASERNVTLRPTPGAMTYLTALLPLAQGVAMLANLRRAAESARSSGDTHTLGQLMADTLVERATGQASADAVPVAVHLVMSDTTLLGAGSAPATLDGGHQVPAQIARELVARGIELADPLARGIPRTADGRGAPRAADGLDAPRTVDGRGRLRQVGAWVRRLYADAGGNLVALDSRSRTFPPGLAALLRVRDQGLCRTPWRDAPAAHLDHVTPHSLGGPSSALNGQGLCAGCNFTKQAPGWIQVARPGDEHARHTVTTTTPSGLSARSVAPELPAPGTLESEQIAPARIPERLESAVETTFRAIIESSYGDPVAVARGLRRMASKTSDGP